MEIIHTTRTAVTIPCCLCGTPIHPNDANQCGACLAQQFDLKSVMQRGPGGGELIIHQCRECRRYEHTPTFYAHHDPESPQLLAVLLKKIPALSSSNAHGTTTSDNNNNQHSNVKLVDSSWIWTEPHSMRLKLRLTVRAEVSDRSVTIQQRLPVEFVVRFNQCPDCNRTYTNRTWHALVQIRQRNSTSRHSSGTSGSSTPATSSGLAALERTLAGNPHMRKHVLRVETVRHGFDFYFLQQAQAQSFVSWVGRVVPIRSRNSSKLVSEDVRNNVSHMKFTTVCDLVERVTNGVIKLVDASPARGGRGVDLFADLHPEKYWKGEKYYKVLLESRRLVRFVVLDVELCSSSFSVGEDKSSKAYNDESADGINLANDGTNEAQDVSEDNPEGEERPLYTGPRSGIDKYALADVEVARESDLGTTDETFHLTTHLGNLLQTGDVVLGYDLVTSVMSGYVEMVLSFNSSFVMPDVVLVKKAKSGIVVEDDEDVGSTGNKVGGRKERAKSSGSKKRERRRRKYEKKTKALQDTAVRMGFVEEDKDEADNDEEKRISQEGLEIDSDLLEELDKAERMLEATAAITLDPAFKSSDNS